MNGVALLLAAASLAVDYSWEKNNAGQVEYMVRVEAEVVPSLIAGEEIHSEVPAEAGAVERFRLKIGLDAGPPVFTPAAPGRLGAAGDRTVMLVRSNGRAEEVQGVSFGWQPDTDGKLLYYVQLDPQLLKSLVVGDEIQATVDRSVDVVNTFVVFGGNKQLPQIPSANSRFGGATTGAAASPLAPLTGAAGTDAGNTLAGDRFGPIDGGTAPAAATETPGTSRFGGATGTTGPDAAAQPTSRFGADSKTGAPATGTGLGSNTGTNAPSEPAGTGTTGTGSRFGGTTGTGFGSNNSTNTPNSSFGNTQPGTFNPPPLDTQSPPASNFPPQNTGTRPPLNYQGANTPSNTSSGSDLYPGNGQGGGYRDPAPPQNQPPARNYDTRPTLEPPQANSAARPLSQLGADNGAGATNQPNTQFGGDRMAMVDPGTTRGGMTLNNQQPVAAQAPVTVEKPWWWGWLVFASCALFLSVGGNLYLGWTAVEFYHRYQRAVERLRSSTVRA